MNYKDIQIKTNDPVEADRILQHWGILMEGGGTDNPDKFVKDKKSGNYKARCLSGDTKFAKFAIKNQGYTFMEIID